MTRLTLAAILATTTPFAAAADTPIPGLDVSYASIACEVRPQSDGQGGVSEWWLTREVTFEDGRIEAVFTTYGGPGCGFAIQELNFAGRVDVLGTSDVAEGAYEANLTIDEFVTIKPLAQPFADFLNSAPEGVCGSDWKVGEAQDILASGCALLGVEPNTPTVEYEILAVEGDMVYFGARKVDGSFLTTPEDRPQALLVPAKRVN